MTVTENLRSNRSVWYGHVMRDGGMDIGAEEIQMDCRVT